MKKLLPNSILIILILLISSLEGTTCTTFCIKDVNNLVLGKNFDFYTGVGHVVINKRNVRKLSFNIPFERSFEWTSRHGSITFNQMGREFPYGGINEKGLVVEQMWLAETAYPERDKRYGLFELQWIQYQLDNSATVDDVLASDSIVRISKMSGPVHFLVCDSKGNMATIEYLGGKMIYHTESTLPICALANDTYDKSKDYVNRLANGGTNRTNSFTSGSFGRFAKAAAMIQNFDGHKVIDYSFDILGAVSQGDFTRWSIVYDIKNRTIHYRTQNNPHERILHVSDFDFSCSSPSLYIDIEDDMQNGKLSFHTYSYQKNRETMNMAFNTIADKVEFKDMIPKEEERELIARYPELARCKE